MNGGTLSGLITAALLVAFVGGWVWAWGGKRKAAFDAAARLPLEDDEPAAPAPAHERTPHEKAP